MFKNKNIGLLLFILIAIVLTGCASREKIVYLQNIETIEKERLQDFSPTLRPDDKLMISVSSLDLIVDTPFNLFEPARTEDSASKLQRFLIAKDGTIELPQLGQLKLGGLSRLEAVGLIKKKLKPFLKKPIVNLQILNFKVTVLGEVKEPGTYTIGDERVTLLEAIGLAGDLTIYGKRKNIIVIRETEKGIVTYKVDITDASFINTPAYFLQQNDVVYVEPNRSKLNNSISTNRLGIIFSAISLLVTIYALIIRK